MKRYVGKRVLASVATVFLMSAFVFLALQAIPGDAAIVSLGEYYAIEDVAALREKMGLDHPLHVQYARWLVRLAHGDLGESLRTGQLEVLNQDYIRTGRAKGLLERCVITHHALRNALIPLITVVGLQFGDLLGRTVIIEEIFSLPGLGRMIVGGVFNRDYPAVMAAILLVSIGYTLANLTVDLLYGRIDPRIRYE